MEQEGVARSVAMKNTGHKTEHVYRHYAIVADAELQEASRRVAARDGDILGTFAPIALDSRAVTTQNP